MNSMHVVSYISLFLMTDFPALEIIQFSQEVVPRIAEYVHFVQFVHYIKHSNCRPKKMEAI